MFEDPKCPTCGSPLDIVIENGGGGHVNGCTNPDCESNTMATADRRTDPTR
jgi:ssDNA-binding Zn-finger/Zn-ribbon topoisomerase 1